MSRELIRYDAARHAIAEAKRVDEIKLIRDQSAQVAAAARVAKDRTMIADATEIQVRAERRLGELLSKTEKAKGAKGVGPIAVRPKNHNGPPTLAAQGIDKKLSMRAQQLAKVNEQDFERAVTAAREIAGEVSAAVVLGKTRAAESTTHARSSSKADSDTPVVIPADKPKAEWDRAQEVMEAIETLGAGRISAAAVWGSLDQWQYKRIRNNIDAAIEFLKSVQEAEANVIA